MAIWTDYHVSREKHNPRRHKEDRGYVLLNLSIDIWVQDAETEALIDHASSCRGIYSKTSYSVTKKRGR